ncbi:MAG: amidohydrolase family protein, partial [Muricoprocola sp.]
SDGTIAGSATNLYDCMRNVVSIGVPEEDAIFAATRNPAKSIGIYEETGSLTPGKRADIVLADEELNLVRVL